MNSLSELMAKINTLPRGTITKKLIHNKEYFYIQYYENGKIVSRYIPQKDIEIIKKQLEERKQLEIKIKELESKQKYVKKLSLESKSLSGYLMMGDRKVAEFSEGVCLYFHPVLSPLIIQRNQSIMDFLSIRIIDNTRTNARLLKRALNISHKDDSILSLYAYGASITDNYWFKAKHSKLKYKDVTFQSDVYANLSLKGEITILPNKLILTPEITTSGSFEKGWKYINNHWYLYKSETKEQIFSELFAYHFSKLLGIATAEYEYDDGFIRSRNFAERYNFSPIYELVGDDDSYEKSYKVLRNISQTIANDYLKLIYVDAILANFDRHSQNYGVMRDKENGKIVSLAPNFDNNLCLIGYSNKLNNNPAKEGFMQLFIKFLNNNPSAKEQLNKNHIPNISEQDIEKIIAKIETSNEVDSKFVKDFVYKRSQYLKEFLSRN